MTLNQSTSYLIVSRHILESVFASIGNTRLGEEYCAPCDSDIYENLDVRKHLQGLYKIGERKLSTIVVKNRQYKNSYRLPNSTAHARLKEKADTRKVLSPDHVMSSMTSQECLECYMTSQECLECHITSEKNVWNVT